MSGSIRGVAFGTSWQVLTQQPDENYEREVHLPADLPKPRVLASFHQAWVLSPGLGAWVWIPVVLLGLLVRWLIDKAGVRLLRRN